MESYSLRLFGGFRLERADGTEVSVASRKGQALLALVATSPGRSMTRSALADALWGDRADEQARASLRQCLFDLRRSVGEPELLAAVSETVSVTDSQIKVDVAEFERLRGATDLASLQRAGLLYADFLAGFDLRERVFNDWLREQREQLKQKAIDLLDRASDLAQEDGQNEVAIELARRQIAIDRAHEAGHRRLMKLYAEAGRRNDALRQFQACVVALREELQIEPDFETQVLNSEIRDGTYGKSAPETVPAVPTVLTAAASDALEFAAPTPPMARPAGRRLWPWVTGVAVAAALGVVAGAVWFQRLAAPPSSATECVRPSAARLSAAVLPFANLSHEPSQEYHALAPEIGAALQKSWDFYVADARSASRYSDPAAWHRIQCDLGVQYVVHGYARKSAEVVRVTFQLISFSDRRSLLTERLEFRAADSLGPPDDVIADIARQVANNSLNHQTRKVLDRKDTRDLQASDFVLRGRHRLFGATEDSNVAARRDFEAAIVHDRHYAKAYAYLAYTFLNDYRLGWAKDPRRALELAREYAEVAVKENPDIPDGWEALADTLLWARDHARALHEAGKALERNEKEASVHALLSDIHSWSGNPESALVAIRRAMDLNRFFPRTYHWQVGHALYLQGKYPEAVGALREALRDSPDFLPAQIYLAGALVALDQVAAVQPLFRQAVERNPKLSADVLRELLPYSNQAETDRLIARLRLLGLPEAPRR